ncbi:serine-rich adhesin for platelets-like isoform X2 [Argopecten irradians]|uniref:serine-rich adhesin for platelets-like isoform X2 n=1 Tax=Argopecten irradians TaxID=31199 RepID=UPI00371D3D5D
MHPYNQSFNRGMGQRQQGFNNVNNNCSNTSRNSGQFGNRNQFPVQSQFGNNSQNLTNVYGNSPIRPGFQGGWNNSQRQFSIQQNFPNFGNQQHGEHARRWMEHQRSRSYPDHFGRGGMQQEYNEINSPVPLRERPYLHEFGGVRQTNMGNETNSPAGVSGGRRFSPEFDQGRHITNGRHCQTGREALGIQNLERIAQRCFGQDDTTWEHFKPKLLNMMQNYFGAPADNHAQRMQGFTPRGESRTTSNQKPSPPFFRNKRKNKKRGKSYFYQGSDLQPCLSNQGMSNADGSSTYCGNETSAVKDNNDMATAMAAKTLLGQSLPCEHASETTSMEQACLDKETEKDSNSDCMSTEESRSQTVTRDGNLKVSDGKDELCDLLPISTPSLPVCQQDNPPSVVSVGESADHVTQSEESTVDHVQLCLELVSLDSETSTPLDSEGNTGSAQKLKDTGSVSPRQPITAAEKHKATSPVMKNRKCFGVSLQKNVEKGKTWSSDDYFTGGGQGEDKTKSSPGQSSGDRISGERQIGSIVSIETISQGNKNDTYVPRSRQDCNWKEGRLSDMPEKGSVQDRRGDWHLPGKRESYRAETIMRGSGKDSRSGDQRMMKEPIKDAHLEDHKLIRGPERDSFTDERLRDSRKDSYSRDQRTKSCPSRDFYCDDPRMMRGPARDSYSVDHSSTMKDPTSDYKSGHQRTVRDTRKDSWDQSSRFGGRGTDRTQHTWQQKTSERFQYQSDNRRPHHSPNRSFGDRETPRQSGLLHSLSPRSQQEKPNYYSPEIRNERNRAKDYKNSRNKSVNVSNKRSDYDNTNEKDRASDDSSQSSQSSWRSHNRDQCHDKQTPSSNKASSTLEPRSRSDSVSKLDTSTDSKSKHSSDHKNISKCFDEPKEQSLSLSTSEQRRDAQILQEQVSNERNMDEPVRQVIEQKIDKQQKTTQNTNPTSMAEVPSQGVVDSTISEQKSHDVQRSEKIDTRESNMEVGVENKMSGAISENTQSVQGSENTRLVQGSENTWLVQGSVNTWLVQGNGNTCSVLGSALHDTQGYGSQCSTNFQTTAKKIVKQTVMEHESKICIKESKTESSKTTVDQEKNKADKNTDQSSILCSTTPVQTSDNSLPIIEHSENESGEGTEMEISDNICDNDDHGVQVETLQDQHISSKDEQHPVELDKVHQDSSQSNTMSTSAPLPQLNQSANDVSSGQPPSDVSDRQRHLGKTEKNNVPDQNVQKDAIPYSPGHKPDMSTSEKAVQEATCTANASQLFQKDLESVNSVSLASNYSKVENTHWSESNRHVGESESQKSFYLEDQFRKQNVSVRLIDIFQTGSHNKDKEVRSFRSKSTHEGETQRYSHHSSSQGKSSSTEHNKVKDSTTSGGNKHSSDSGRSRSHSKDIDSHAKDKKHHTSHRHKERRLTRESSNDSNLNSDSDYSHTSRRHQSRGDKSHRHRHRHRSKGERKEGDRPRSKDLGSSSSHQSDRRTDNDRQRHTDLCNGGSDDDIDEEDSDDELETPFFLTSLNEASCRPIPTTPTKGINASYTESPTPGSPQISLAPLSSFNSGFSLDALLAEAIDKTSDERQCEDMHVVLEEGLRKGGFVKDTLEVTEEPVAEDDLLPEHKIKLKKLQIHKSEMSEIHTGENIFQANRYQCLFNASVSLQACGFVPGTTYIDKHLATIQPADYLTLLTSDIMQMCFEAISCKDAVLRWLLFIMSVHPSHLLVNCCYKTIQEHLYSCQHSTCSKAKYTWSPAVTDILSILCNYGANPSDLLPKSSLVTNEESVQNSLFHQNAEIVQDGKYNRENFRLVLHSLALAFQIRPKYTDSQLTQMIVMICKVALDKSLNSFMLTHEIEVVVASLLKLYTDMDWIHQSMILCRELSSLTAHHHNQVYLAQLLPPTNRGQFLQRRVSYLMVHKLIYPERKVPDDVMQFQMNQVHNILPQLQGLADKDIYLLSSCVSLLDLCIGNGQIKSAEKNDLEYITEQMKKLTGEVRDNVCTLDRTRIKDMMIRLTLKWTLVVHSIGSKQKTLFECQGNFHQSTTKLKIETVDVSQTDQASESEEEDAKTEDDNKEDQTKVKTVTIDVKEKDPPSDNDKMEVDDDDDDLPEL